MFKWFVFVALLALVFAEPEAKSEAKAEAKPEAKAEAKPEASHYGGKLVVPYYYGGYAPHGDGHGSWGYQAYAHPYYYGGYWSKGYGGYYPYHY